MGWMEFNKMNDEKIKKLLEEVQHELTTLHNLTVTDNIESGVTWVTNTDPVLVKINDLLKQL